MLKTLVKGTGGSNATAGAKTATKVVPKDPGLPTNIVLTKKAYNLNQGCKFCLQDFLCATMLENSKKIYVGMTSGNLATFDFSTKTLEIIGHRSHV